MARAEGLFQTFEDPTYSSGIDLIQKIHIEITSFIFALK